MFLGRFGRVREEITAEWPRTPMAVLDSFGELFCLSRVLLRVQRLMFDAYAVSMHGCARAFVRALLFPAFVRRVATHLAGRVFDASALTELVPDEIKGATDTEAVCGKGKRQWESSASI